MASRAKIAASRESRRRIGRAGSPGARTRRSRFSPASAIRISQVGRRPTSSCGPMIRPRRKTRTRPGKASSTARSQPTFSVPYSPSPRPARGEHSKTGESSVTGSVGQVENNEHVDMNR